MTKIAISYRRSDSQDITGRIFDRLIQRFGRDTVFRDIDSILPGIDFRDQIADALASTSVLVSIVGPRWAGQIEEAGSRLDNEADPVRIEVEMAMRRAIPVIPVLVGGAAMPPPSQLPEAIKDFAYRHAIAVDGGRDFDHHVNGLIRALEYFLRREPAPPEASTTEPSAAAPVENPAMSVAAGAASAGEAAVVQAVVGASAPLAPLAPPPSPTAVNADAQDEGRLERRPNKVGAILRGAGAGIARFCKFMAAGPSRPAPIPILVFVLRYLALIYVAIFAFIIFGAALGFRLLATFLVGCFIAGAIYLALKAMRRRRRRRRNPT